MIIQVAILAGGLAARLGKLAQDQPKSMVRVLGKPFLEYQLELLRENGVRDVVLCIGHLGEQIEAYFGDGSRFEMNLKYSRESRPLGTAGALKNAHRLLNDIFFTMYGDSYLFIDFRAMMSYFTSRSKLALMSVYKNYDRYDRSNTAVQRGVVKRFSKREKTEDMVYIEYGINLFRKRVLDLVPQDEPYGLEALFPQLIQKEELLAFEVKERFYEVGSAGGLGEFRKYIKGAK